MHQPNHLPTVWPASKPPRCWQKTSGRGPADARHAMAGPTQSVPSKTPPACARMPTARFGLCPLPRLQESAGHAAPCWLYPLSRLRESAGHAAPCWLYPLSRLRERAGVRGLQTPHGSNPKNQPTPTPAPTSKRASPFQPVIASAVRPTRPAHPRASPQHPSPPQ